MVSEPGFEVVMSLRLRAQCERVNGSEALMYRTGRGVGSLAACSSCEDSEATDSGNWRLSKLEREEGGKGGRRQRRAREHLSAGIQRSHKDECTPLVTTMWREAQALSRGGRGWHQLLGGILSTGIPQLP